MRRVGSAAYDGRGARPNLIDRLHEEISQRLDQLLGEAEKLRRALAALDPRGESSAAKVKTAPSPRSAVTERPARAAGSARPRTRTAPGATKARVLAALADGKAMTAGEVAAATGLARPTVSTTLTRLAKAGEVVKAERGYRLPAMSEASGSPRRSGAT